ncbi:MAG: hypothetical protein JJE52_18265 [Acidimicrobiia bacterium]|nr:hypothetical protein [Acidimicrobiia bacterium]
MVTGSVAATHHGEPRLTQDIDIVVDPTPEALEQFLSLLDRERFYVDDARRALRDRSQFNVLDLSTGWKVDLIISKNRPFSITELERRIPIDILGVRTFVASPEDVILSKLEWSKDSGSEVQLRDIETLMRVQWDHLDRFHLRRWAAVLGVERRLEEIISRVARDEGEPQ